MARLPSAPRRNEFVAKPANDPSCGVFLFRLAASIAHAIQVTNRADCRHARTWIGPPRRLRKLAPADYLSLRRQRPCDGRGGRTQETTWTRRPQASLRLRPLKHPMR